MVLAMVMGAPLVPSKPTLTKRMVELLRLKPGQTLYDLGSGDGRVLLEAAAQGINAYGVEINPYALIISFIRALFTKRLSLIKLKWGNYWWVSLRRADGIVVYGLPHIMPKLAKKFKTELRPKTRIVSNSFVIPGLTLVKQEKIGKDRIYLYEI